MYKNLKKADVVITSKGKIGIIVVPKMFYVVDGNGDIICIEDYNGMNYIDNDLVKNHGYKIVITEPVVAIRDKEFEISENNLTKVTKFNVSKTKYSTKYTYEVNNN